MTIRRTIVSRMHTNVKASPSDARLYGRLDQLRPLEAMRVDAKTAAYLCVDAMGIVQAAEMCAPGHVWGHVAPARHVIFAFRMKHDSFGADEFLADYAGYVMADAHAVF